MEASFAKSILVDAPMAVVAIDGEGTIRTANATAESFFGGRLTGETNRSIADLIDGLRLTGDASADDVAAFNVRSRSGGEGVHMQARRLDGTTVPVDIQAARFSAVGENFVTLFIQDVTAVMEAEQAVQELRLQITQNWRLNSLGEMASMLAHELNQPLSAIANHLHAAEGLLNRAPSDPGAARRSIASAQAQAQRAGDTIRRLRALMSRDTGYHKSEQLAEVIGEIMPILNISAREMDAEVMLDIHPDHRTDCDRVQLQQLIFNLVRNAIEAPANDRRREVMISGQCLGHGAYRIRVEDNGPGFAPHIREHLFDPLASTKPDGMGLGLSICRTIVEAHGGTIVPVDSRLGGAAFAFSLNEAQAKAA
ncbi:histidine kinase [Brevundimonas sp. AAP58]|uniref:sensor histidine kinase n=1 Tax=Brevundimonas sp. AAP58 TaxID=1523422 RepID=UPI0006B9C6C9|nr:ATP-binding protein [Brevundimonas sp. AAP58]KPF81264.1 histidine kinase [Brevundimonas sp. AAP58]